MSEVLKKISDLIVEGEDEEIVDAVQEALDGGVSADDILNGGLLAGMDIVGKLFADDELCVPEVLLSAQTMAEGLTLIKPLLSTEGGSGKGKAVAVTVQGDLHDIGKKLVVMMLEGQGYEVTDLGVDVNNEEVVAKVKEIKPDLLCMSAMLTTTMQNMDEVCKMIQNDPATKDVKVMIGGAPVTKDFASKIGANYSLNASEAVDLANELVQK